MTIQIALLLSAIVAAMVLFSIDRIPTDVTALSVLMFVILTGLLPAEAAFAGFGSDPVLMILGLLVSILFLRSRAGQFALAARDDDEASAALGIPVVRYKVLTMMVSAALMATAGTLYLQYYLFIDPDLAFGSAMSIQAILPAVIGGVATIWGPVIGAVVLGPLTDITATLLRNPPPFLDFLAGRGGLDVVVYGILLVIIILVLPKGIYGALRDRWSRR